MTLIFKELENGLAVYMRKNEIAHIAESGKITWYVRPDSIPGNELLRVEHYANAMKEHWNQKLDTMTEQERYTYLLRKVPRIASNNAVNMQCSTEQKIMYLKNVLYQKSTFKACPEMIERSG